MPNGQAVTGKPMADYEPFVELVALAIANGIANMPEWIRTGVLKADQPIESQTPALARILIEWRGAFYIDEAIAACSDKRPRGEEHAPAVRARRMPQVR